MTGLTQTDGLHPTGNDAATLDPAQFHMQQLASSKAAMTMPANFRTQLLANSEAEMTELLQLQTQPSASSDPAMTGPASSNTAMTRPESNYASNIVPVRPSICCDPAQAKMLHRWESLPATKSPTLNWPMLWHRIGRQATSPNRGQMILHGEPRTGNYFG